MAASILHRISGEGLTFVGLPVVLWWLGALVSGPEAYASFTGWMWADFSSLEWSGGAFIASLAKVLLKIVLVGLSWAFFTHLCSGLRHLVLDTGANYELANNKIGSIVAIAGGLLLTAAFWAVIALR